MGNTLCKPVIQVQQIVEQSKTIEPLLTEEAIKILNVQNEAKEKSVISETKEPVVSETKESVISETKEPVVSETKETEPIKAVEIVLEPVISETKEPVPVITEPEVVVETLSIVQPDEVSSISSKEEDEVPPLKKKRGRKKKGEQ